MPNIFIRIKRCRCYGVHDTSPDTQHPKLQDEIGVDQLYDCIHGQQLVKLFKNTFVCFKHLSRIM
jgi:hypothetical protein